MAEKTKNLPEPAIVGYGRDFIDNYPAEEFQASLVRAFKDKRADYICLDDNLTGQKFTAASIAWALKEGILYHDEDIPDDPDFPQSITSTFRLTEEGKEKILGTN